MRAADAPSAGRLLVPALRWRPGTGYAHEAPAIDRALAAGVGGFLVFGGSAHAVRELTAELRRRSRVRLLIGADLERGAGQQFDGATPLPPLAALGAVDDVQATRSAAALTAREALALGVDWILAPVADVDLEAANPIVGTRAFGAEPARVAKHVAAWTEACRAAGALTCAKHFPGHGRTTADSHAELPRVSAARRELEADLVPFRAAIGAGVDAVMTAHVVYDALDAERPATLSARVVGDVLRGELGFTGLVATDALNMAGVTQSAGGEAAAAIAAVEAGCDALLYPDDPESVLAALQSAVGRRITEARVSDALARIDAATARAASRRHAALVVGRVQDRDWARKLGTRAIAEVRGALDLSDSFDVLTIDDDVGGPHAVPTRTVLLERLRHAGIDARAIDSPSRGGRALAIALYSDPRAWKQRAGLSTGALRFVESALASCPTASVLLFGHPRLAYELSAGCVVAAWGGEPIMQEALADWIAARANP